MDNKLNNMLNEFLENCDAKDDAELNKKLQEFMQKLNNGEIEYENTPLDDAYELLDKAQNAKTEAQAIKYAKQACEVCPDCFDAYMFLAQYEKTVDGMLTKLDEALENERKRLEKEKYFTKDTIGRFYGIFETRPYIMGLYLKAQTLACIGKLTLAKEICQEILRLNDNDNTGARYLLMAIYAGLEDEKDALNLYKKYSEEQLEMLFPLLALYYKLGNDTKAKMYLDKINKSNPYFIQYFKHSIKREDTPKGCYAKGKASEVLMYFDEYDFLTNTMPFLRDFVLSNSQNVTSKSKKNKKK